MRASAEPSAHRTNERPASRLACERRLTLAVAILVMASGFAGLVYQTAWFRLFRSVFGASTAAHASVVACFLGGLGLGAWVLGKRADRVPAPLRLYAALELGAALAAACTPWLIAWLEVPYHALAQRWALGVAGRTVLRLGVTLVVLALPTFLMGGALPAVIRVVEVESDRARRRAGLLYGANTLGALLGTLAATLVLLERLGTRATLFGAAAVGVIVAALAAALDRRPTMSALRVEGGAPSAPKESGPAGAGPSSRSFQMLAGDLERAAAPRVAPGERRMASLGAALAGLAFGLLELVWYRMLAPLLGGSTYTFGLILALVLGGVGIGAVVFGSARRGHRPTLATLALVSALEALVALAPLAAGDRLAELAIATRALGDGGFPRLVGVWLGIAALAVLPTAIVSGYQFPLFVALAGEGDRDAGRESGHVFAWNSAGNLLGALGGGLVLIPFAGALAAWRIAVAVLAVLAVACAATTRGGGSARWPTWAALAVVALVAVLAVAPGPTAVWRHQPIGVGGVPRSFPNAGAARDHANAVRRTLAWERDGRESAIGISNADGEALLVNGKSDGNIRNDAATHAMGGLIPAALHPNPRLALVIGFGTGSTAAWLAQGPGLERVDVLELEPAVLELARRGSAITRNVLADPRVRVVIGDARESLGELTDRYDVIFSEPSNPYRAGVASLFTVDFFREAAARLAPGGLFAEWLQVYDLDPASLRLVYATLGAAFAEVETWETQLDTDLLLVASAAPIDHDRARLGARLTKEPFGRALDWVWGVDGLAGFYTGFLGSPRFARAFVASAAEPLHPNTDDRNALEFAAARSLGHRDRVSVAELRRGAASVDAARPVVASESLDWAHVRELRAVRALAEEAPLASFATAADPDPRRESRRRAREAYAQGDVARAAWLWPDLERVATGSPSGDSAPMDRVVLAELLASRADERARDWIDAVAARRPATAECLWTLLADARHDPASVAAHGLEALRLLAHDPWVHRPLVLRTLSALYGRAEGDAAFGRTLFTALAEPLAVSILDDTRRTLRAEVGMAADFDGLCVEALAPLEPWVPWREALLESRSRCYEAHGDARAAHARADLTRFRSERGATPAASP